MRHPWVILFDIDGTLLTVNSNFNRPLLRSIVNGLKISYNGVETDPFSGRTDHDILSSFLENHGFDQSLYQQLKQIYLERLTTELRSEHILRHLYVDEAVAFFSGDNFVPGLLTGNFPSAAETKLKAANINLDFKIGAFGDVHKDRNMLPQLALNKFEQLFDFEADPKKFVVIGDTPRDIQCAQSAGMRSVAVTTGSFNHDELASFNPDLIIESLKNPEIWFKQLIENEVNQTSNQL
ncbi:MAG: HAD hydrolase-like protein [Balneolaceae bacterium]|nr:HAD hydrolase-like protein [Balneolaceae bacterium]